MWPVEIWAEAVGCSSAPTPWLESFEVGLLLTGAGRGALRGRLPQKGQRKVGLQPQGLVGAARLVDVQDERVPGFREWAVKGIGEEHD